jgi:hypothetical protein
MKRTLLLFLTLLFYLSACRKDQSEKSVKAPSGIELDPLFMQWGQSANGRWVPYTCQKIDKNTLTKSNFFDALNTKVQPVCTNRKFYEQLLFEKYGNGMGTNAFKLMLDSLYKKNYTRINASLQKRVVMDSLYSSYEKAIPILTSRVSTMSIDDGEDLPEVVVTACMVPQSLKDFFNIYINVPIPLPPMGSTQEIKDCHSRYLAEVDNWIKMIKYEYNDGDDCAIYTSFAYESMRNYYECDILDPFPGDSPSDPYPPSGGGGGGTTTPPPVQTQPTDPSPCSTAQDASNLASGFSANNAFTSAKSGVVSAAADGLEHAVSFGKDANGNIITSAISNGNSNSSGAPAITNKFADLHSHPGNLPPSSGDIYGLIDIFENGNGAFQTRYIVTPNGTVYAIVMTDILAMFNFNVEYPREPNVGFEPDFPEEISDEINRMKQLGNATDEMAIAFILDKYNTGIALLKQNANGDFKRVNTIEYTDANGVKTYTTNTCP